jgi:disulfide oxidoreductase YuzD
MRFGEAVEVEYVDMADANAQARFPELLDAVQEHALPYPLVAVDGQVRLAGTAQYYRILPLVEAALKFETEP